MRFTSVMVAGVLVCLTLAGAAAADPMSPDELHSSLHLTPAQEPAWRAYQAAISPDPAARTRQQATQMLLPTLTTPRRIDLLDAQMDATLAAMRRQGEAVKAFYATLTPAQQHAFDAATAPSSDDAPSSAPLRRPPSY
jgi:hypothetical protein